MITCDIDNTIINTNGELKQYKSNTYPYAVPAGFFDSPEGRQALSNALPLKDAATVLRLLAKQLGGVTYVTTRPRETEILTKRQLKQHGFPRGRMIFCSRADKVSVITALNPCLIAEDDPGVIPELLELGVPVLVKQWDYNRHLQGDRLVMFKHWNTELIGFGIALDVI